VRTARFRFVAGSKQPYAFESDGTGWRLEIETPRTAEAGRQKAEGRRHKAEGRRQKAEGTRQKAEDRRH
jgi:hypothetical protein